MHWVLLANGPFTVSPAIRDVIFTADRLVGVDGGNMHLRALDARPHLAVGDMDSIPEELLAEYRREGVEMHLHPPKKDATDLELALEMALTGERPASPSSGPRAAGSTTPSGTSFCWPVACPSAFRPASWTTGRVSTSRARA